MCAVYSLKLVVPFWVRCINRGNYGGNSNGSDFSGWLLYAGYTENILLIGGYDAITPHERNDCSEKREYPD